MQANKKFKIEIESCQFGIWKLGYAWVTVSIGNVAATGLSLYARKRTDKPVRRVVFGIKEAINFFEKHKIPAYSAGKLLATATDNGDWDRKEAK
jgi:hypothetical protein